MALSGSDNAFSSKPPLTSYDILGYFAPGLTLIISLVIFEHYIFSSNLTGVIDSLPFYQFFHFIKGKLSVVHSNWGPSLAIISLVLIIAFIVGHIIASLSALLIEGILLAKGLGYPHQLLLRKKSDSEFKILSNKRLDKISEINSLSAIYYRGLFTWVNIYFLLLIADIFLAASPIVVSSPENTWLGIFTTIIKHNLYLLYTIIGITILKIIFTDEIFESSTKKSRFRESKFYLNSRCYFRVALRYIFSSIFDVLFYLVTEFLRKRQT